MRLTPLFKQGTSELRGEMISDQCLCIATGFPDIGHQNRQQVNENLCLPLSGVLHDF